MRLIPYLACIAALSYLLWYVLARTIIPTGHLLLTLGR
jgi:hypothetical protein